MSVWKLARCLVEAAGMLVLLSMIAFAIVRFSGDPVEALVEPGASATQTATLRLALGLERPLFVQYVDFASGLLSAELGVSYRHRRPVAEILSERLPATLELAFLAFAVSIVAGFALGIGASLRPTGFLTKALMRASVVSVSMPTFLVAILLVWIFSIELQWLPAFGRGETLALGWWSTGLLTASGLASLVLPVITLALCQSAWLAQLVYAEMRVVLRAPFITAARARGLSEWHIACRHALPNALLPVIALSGMQLGYALAFAIVTESVFQWPGLGSLFLDAVLHADLPVISAYIVLTGALFVVLGLVVDLLALWVTPGLRAQPLVALP